MARAFTTLTLNRWGWLAGAYAALIVYASLYPFIGWRDSHHGWLTFLAADERHRIHLADGLTNVLAYVPFGALVARALTARGAWATPIGVAVLTGAALSVAMEFTQQFLPSRIASLADLITNMAGTLIGAVFARFAFIETLPVAALAGWRERWIRRGRLGEIGLLAIGLWLLSQLAPLVPSFDVGGLRSGLAPLWQTLQHPDRFSVAQWAGYTLDIAGLALLARTLVNSGRPVALAFTAFVVCVLFCKIPVIGRQLSFEALAGALTGIVLAQCARALRPKAIAALAAVLILGGFAIDELRATSSSVFVRFDWIPFRAQLERPLIGIGSILESLWPAAALAYLARFGANSRNGTAIAGFGGASLVLIAFGLEWKQQFVPGRIGDITTVLLMIGAWSVIWTIPIDARAPREDGDTPARLSTGTQRRAWLAAIVLGAAVAVGASTAVISGHRAEMRSDESKALGFPRPEELPPVQLPYFAFAHPRLPHPAPAELATLRMHSPDFESRLRARANGGRGDFHAAMLQAYAEPGSVDLNELFRRLEALRFAGRGDAQVKPLAVAYDWLHAQWTDAQQAQLRDKLAQGCAYVIDVIRRGQLSPYNVILYNAPLQALMACAIALYGDGALGEPAMRFTHNLWKNRVLPVWRQVMGINGGWHEGGEYVGIGVGQAIYTLPAMWRSATGEDFVAAEPGIRGFLDFLVYRTRPDGTHFRWGDGAYFDRAAPDATPLALELRNAAAYSLQEPSDEIVPTGWPWGPLADPTLSDATAIARLPLTRLFDGIGMIVARSDWSADATYVTFKAGDNFWSHVHLDQGAFTIYKGGALAIDSGLYGPTYDSDHHMNYAYQTIAHNSVTVTDPDDTVPAPGKREPRPIANDGGQRRVGSGWGAEPAPIDRAEWEAKREAYHTGTLEKVFDEDGLTVALADLTSAYTNARSGEGAFADRTRRVERFRRTFGYDRVDDAVVVFDQVTATRASFRKRWLLHTIEAPEVTADGFRAHVSPQSRSGHAGGTLTAKVLLPAGATITAVGGPGLEFLVDGRNYDENGTLQATIAKLPPNKGEPGAWRIQVAPPRAEADDLFLVVLLPSLGDATPNHRVRLLRDEGRVGCEIVGPHRTTRWWFRPGHGGAEIEVDTGTDYHRHRIEGDEPPPARAWLDRLREWSRQWTH